MGDWLGVLVAVVLLLANAFFVGAEFALISARRSSIEPLAEAGSRRARTTLAAMERLGLDPALASGTFVTTLTDVMGFLAFLGLATVILL